MTVKVNLNGTNELDFPSGVSSATTSEGVTTINLSGGGGATATLEHVFTGAGTQNFVHNLNSLYPLTTVYVKSGATAYSMSPVDANTMAVTVPGASDIVIAFGATSALPSSYSFTVSPTSATYNPTMGGTQTVNYTITQSGSGGYAGTVNYTVSGLASGMTGTITPSSITGSSGTATLAVSFPATQPVTTTTFTVTGNDGTTANTASPGLTITDINSGLLDGWEMNEGSGTTFSDATSNANQQTFSAGIGSWGTVSGFPGSAYTFNGTGYATGSNDTLTNFDGTAAFTISFWCNLSSSSGSEALVQDWATGPIGWSVNSLGGDLSFTFETSTAGLGSHTWSTAITGGLHYIAITYSPPLSGATIYAYVDGAQQSVFNPSSKTGTMASGQPVTIGGSPVKTIGGTTYTPASGTIGYVRIYSGAKTSAQISAYYAAGPR